MKCPFCGFENDKVVDSRESKEADSIRRRRECLKCGKRFTTYERIDEIPYMVVKKDGRREKFDRQKVLNGLLRACEKRPVPISKLEQIVNEAESFVIESAERERKTSELGELIMNRLRRYDKVAYVRFASVYLDFKDVQEFMAELKDLLKTKEAPDVRSKGVKKSSGAVALSAVPRASCPGDLKVKPRARRLRDTRRRAQEYGLQGHPHPRRRHRPRSHPGHRAHPRSHRREVRMGNLSGGRRGLMRSITNTFPRN